MRARISLSFSALSAITTRTEISPAATGDAVSALGQNPRAPAPPGSWNPQGMPATQLCRCWELLTRGAFALQNQVIMHIQQPNADSQFPICVEHTYTCLEGVERVNTQAAASENGLSLYWIGIAKRKRMCPSFPHAAAIDGHRVTEAEAAERSSCGAPCILCFILYWEEHWSPIHPHRINCILLR
ncbi:hypothetical protein C8R47DRAFT_1100944 [Mycena vitilis]|nr:hypothetical protein C8R47DRAFT_1100944 [Mycena vitilis]